MAEENTEKPEGKNGGIDIKLIAIGLVFLLLAIAGSYFVSRSVLSPLLPKEEKKTESKEAGTLIALGEITTNISDISEGRYVKTEVYVETSDKTLAEKTEEVTPIMRDEVITILSSKTVDEVAVVKRESLKNEIKKNLNKKLDNKVDNVYFNNFIVQ
ncbi:MAG: flagellar basal body-associated protein FliL [Chitinophagales bacterium]